MFEMFKQVAIQNNVKIDISFNDYFDDSSVRIVITDMSRYLKLSMNYDIDFLRPESILDTLHDMMKTFNKEREKRKRVIYIE